MNMNTNNCFTIINKLGHSIVLENPMKGELLSGCYNFTDVIRYNKQCEEDNIDNFFDYMYLHNDYKFSENQQKQVKKLKNINEIKCVPLKKFIKKNGRPYDIEDDEFNKIKGDYNIWCIVKYDNDKVKKFKVKCC